MTEENQSFWAVVEMMGHQKVAGRVTEVELGGAKLLRVDVPAVPERPAERYYSAQPPIPGYTKFIGGSAVYAITPTTAEVCQRAAEQFRVDPVYALGMEHVERVVIENSPRQIGAGDPEAQEQDAEDDSPF